VKDYLAASTVTLVTRGIRRGRSSVFLCIEAFTTGKRTMQRITQKPIAWILVVVAIAAAALVLLAVSSGGGGGGY
jgi:hypothetical protein